MITKPTRQIACCDCAKPRDAYRPIMRLASGVVCWVCRQCWRARFYDDYMRVAS